MSLRAAFVAAVLFFATPAFAQQAPGAAPPVLSTAQTEFEARSVAFLLLLETMRGEMQAAMTAAGRDQAKAEADLRAIGARYQRRVNTFARETSAYSAMMPEQWAQMRQRFMIEGAILNAPVEIKNDLMWAALGSGTFVLPRRTRARSARTLTQPPRFVYPTPDQAQSAFEARSVAFQQAMETMRGEMQAALTAAGPDHYTTEADLDTIVARYQPGATDFGNSMLMYSAMTPEQWAQMMQRFPIGGQIVNAPKNSKAELMMATVYPTPAEAQSAFEARSVAFQQAMETMRGEMQAALTAAGRDKAKAEADMDAILARYQPEASAFGNINSMRAYSVMTLEQWAQMRQRFPIGGQIVALPRDIKTDLIRAAEQAGSFTPVLVMAPPPVPAAVRSPLTPWVCCNTPIVAASTPVPVRPVATQPAAVRPVAAQPPPAIVAPYVEADAQTCQRYGYSPGATGFADCMMYIDMARQAQARAAAEHNVPLR